MSYSRINYFQKILSEFQDTTEIPQEIIDQILSEIGEYDKLNITVYRIGSILNKLDLHQYRQHHLPAIIYRLHDVKPPIISPEIKIKLKQMFQEIQEPFKEVCYPDRKNFLPFQYVLLKLIELLDIDELKEKAMLLQNPIIFNKYNTTWNNICKILKWK